MKVFIYSLLVVAASASLLEVGQFQVYKKTHGKTYKNQVEETKRLNIFKENLRAIEEHNALYEDGLVSYKKGVNEFTDMSHDEFKALLLSRFSRKPNLTTTEYVKTGIAVPESVDWRTSGQVTGVKDQGTVCGGCWAFATTGASEAAYFRKTGKSVLFSEQQLIDCVGKPNLGCDGGWVENCYPYLKKVGHQSEESYVYEAITNKCRHKSSKVVAKVSGFVAMKEEDEDSLLESVGSVGPVAVYMNAQFINDYSSGIFSDERCNPKDLDHAVLVVGYGSENGQDYWIVKNSWGANWGENGYIRIRRGTNECGIAQAGSYPLM